MTNKKFEIGFVELFSKEGLQKFIDHYGGYAESYRTDLSDDYKGAFMLVYNPILLTLQYLISDYAMYELDSEVHFELRNSYYDTFNKNKEYLDYFINKVHEEEEGNEHSGV